MKQTTNLQLIAGKNYKVVKNGSKLKGQTPIGNWSWEFKSVDLSVGDVIKYEGYVSGWETDNMTQHRFKFDSYNMVSATFLPVKKQEGWYQPHEPEEGYLELIEV